MSRLHLYKLIYDNLIKNVVSMFENFIITIPLAIIIASGTAIIIRKRGENCAKFTKTKKISMVLFSSYISIIIQMALLFRTWGCIYEIDLIPFNTPGGYLHIILYAFANTLVFLPLGILLPKIWECMQSIKMCLLAGFSLSLFIEVVQLTLRCGIFQTEDMIMNTVGAGVGYLIWKRYVKKS